MKERMSKSILSGGNGEGDVDPTRNTAPEVASRHVPVANMLSGREFKKKTEANRDAVVRAASKSNKKSFSRNSLGALIGDLLFFFILLVVLYFVDRVMGIGVFK